MPADAGAHKHPLFLFNDLKTGLYEAIPSLTRDPRDPDSLLRWALYIRRSVGNQDYQKS